MPEQRPTACSTTCRIVGLLEGEWPAPTARDIFYPGVHARAARVGRGTHPDGGAARALCRPADAAGRSRSASRCRNSIRMRSCGHRRCSTNCRRSAAIGCVAVPARRAPLAVTREDALAGHAGRPVGARARCRARATGRRGGSPARPAPMRGRPRRWPANATASRPWRRTCSARSSTSRAACWD